MKAIICGTNKDSIGRYIGGELARADWSIWLYSRGAENHDVGSIHERQVDLTHKEDIEELLKESENPDLIVMSVDAGGVFGELQTLETKCVHDFLDSKIQGSINMVQEIIGCNYRTKVVFLCGRNGPKQKDFLLYGVVNSAVMSLVDAINAHYSDTLQAYYLETPPISGSTIATEHRTSTGQDVQNYPMSAILKPLHKIMDGSVPTGLVPFTEGMVL